MTRAEKMIAFIETLRTPDGAGVGQPFVLRGWQKAIIREVYDAEDGEGRRVVRQAVLSMSRKNGKTALVAGLCLAHLCGPEAVRNGQLYSLAHDREQASVLFKLMTAMIYMDEELSERLNVVESRKRLVDPVSGSEFTALSSETRGKHGKSSSFIVFDELAQFGADRELYDVMMTSRGAHADPLVWCISTQAASDNAVLSELIDYGQKVNRGEIEDPKFKTFLFSVPMDADPWDEANWYLANPALGDFRSLEDMREMAEKAKRMPAAEAAFRNLYLNQRVDGAAHFITPDTPRGREMYALMNMQPRPAINGMSIGFRAIEWANRSKPDEPRRTLKRVELVELSLVTFPANGKARVTGIKSDADGPSIRDAEKALRDAGFSRVQAKAILADGFRAMPLRDAEEGGVGELAALVRRNINTLRG